MSIDITGITSRYGLRTDAVILSENPGLDPRMLELDPAIGISDDELVHPKFLFQMGWTQWQIANEYAEYTRFAERLTKVGA